MSIFLNESKGERSIVMKMSFENLGSSVKDNYELGENNNEIY